MWFVKLYIGSRLGILIMDTAIRRLVVTAPESCASSLRGEAYSMTAGDWACVIINSSVETCFVRFLLMFSVGLPWVTFWSPASLLALFVLDDVLYAPYHRMLHTPALFRRIHSRHHRVHHPRRGYVHAVMEHPLEMIGALVLHALVLSACRTWLDQASVWIHTILKAAVAICNHTCKSVKVMGYSSSEHSTHHRLGIVNYAQHVFLWDKIWKTHLPYPPRQVF